MGKSKKRKLANKKQGFWLENFFENWFIDSFIENWKLRIENYFKVPVHTKARYHLFGVFVAAFSITITVILGGYEIFKKVFALNESSFSMPQQVVFNRGESGGLAGYSNQGGLVAVFSDEIRLATSAAWWNGEYLYKKPITLKNLASQPIATSTAQIVVNTKQLYDAGKLQNDCDDLEVVFVATQSGNLREKLSRSYILPSGVSDCANSTATIVSFPLRETVWGNGGIDGNYELYYGNPSASSGNTAKGFDLLRADGSTVSATLVCPFNGTTTCLNQNGAVTPTTATGAIRYSGGKGSALSFDGRDDYVSLNDTYLPAGNSPRTIEFWFKTPINHNYLTYSTMFSYGTLSYYQGISLGTGWDGNINRNTFFVSQHGQALHSGVMVNDNNWHHGAAVFDGTTWYLYLDGILRGSKQMPTNTVLTGNSARVGIYGSSNFYLGIIDEIRVSNIVRYTSNFTPQTTPFEPDEYTVLLLHFDENGDDPRNAGKAIDSSGKGNHGTIYGAKYVSGLVGVDSSSSDTGAISIQPYAGHQGVFIEEGTTNLIINPSFENATVYNKYWSLPYFNYATSSATFTANMAKRNSAGPFAAGVMVSGDLANSQGKTDDVLSIDRGTQIAGNFYQNFDPSQGSVVLWWTPEYSYNASSGTGLHYLWFISSNYYLAYDYANDRFEVKIGGQSLTVSSSIAAGTTYKLISRWDTKNTLDGTNYASFTIDGTTTMGITTAPTAETPSSTIYIGTNGTTGASSGIIEGLTVYRRPLFDNETTTGINTGNGDEVSSSSSDPTLTTGSWDVVFDLPTNASTGSLSSGTGNAWSHPHSSNLLYTSTTNTGGFMMNGAYTADGWADVGTPTSVSALTTNEKIFAGGYKFTTDEAGEGIKYTVSSQPQGRDYVVRAIAHSDGTSIPKIQIWDTVNNHEITQMTATSSASTRTTPEVFLFTFELPYVSRYGGQPGYEWVTSDSNAFEVRLLNSASSGTVYWHQVEVYQNLVDNPSMEVGGGTPWVPAGWVGTTQVGESTQAFNSFCFSGYSCAFMTSNIWAWRSLWFRPLFTYSKFYNTGIAVKQISGVTVDIWSEGINKQPQHRGRQNYASITTFNSIKNTGRFEKNFVVIRTDYTAWMTLGPTVLWDNATFYFDDAYSFQLADVNISFALASQSNSTEITGLRVDGADTLTQPITGWTTASGSAKFKFTPRHSFDVADKFGFSNPVIASAAASTNNDYLKLYKQSSTVLRLEGKFNGNTITADWSNPTLNAGTTYTIEMGYSQNYGIWLTVDGVLRARNPSGVVPFGNVPTTMYFGSDGQGSNQYDGTYTSFVSLTPEQNTTAPYYKFGSKSVKLTAFDREDLYTIAATASASTTHTLSAYVYDGTSGNIGGTVDSSVAQLASSSATLSTTYTDMGGGWWRLTASLSLNAGTHYLGVQVEAGKTVYVDGVQLEQKSYATTYADGSLGSGYSWSGGENESVGVRTAINSRYNRPTEITRERGTISFWMKPYFNWISGKTTGFEGYCILTIGNYECSYPSISFKWIDYDNTDPRRIWGSYYMQPGIVTAGIVPRSDNNSWKHIVLTWDTSDSIKMYENGSLFQSSSPQTPTQTLGSYLIISNEWPGILSDIKIFDVPLSSSEVSALYYQGLQTHASGSETDDRYQSGTYTYISPVIDLSANGAWGSTPIAFTDFLNGGTISYFTRTSPDNINWSSWEAVSGNNIASPPRRYFQWKADISPNSELNQSPVIKGLTLTYVEDTTPPQNPQQVALGYTDSASSSATLVSGKWYNFPRPKFTWEAGEDVAASGQSSSGIDTYRVLLTTDQNATPSANLGDNCYLETQSNQRQFIVGSSPASCSLEDGIYYLRLQTKDNSGNISEPVTMFTYKYDGTAPSAPASVASSDVGYKAVNSFTFFWPAVTDNGPSGLAGYEYKTGTSSGQLANWQFTTNTSVSGIEAYQEGQNYFYVRAKDNAGNYSAVTTNSGTATFYYNSSAPTAPRNLSIWPSTSPSSPASSNSFTVSWDEPASYAGSIAKYYYCVNCTPSADTMTETTPSETVNRRIENAALATQQGKNTFYIVAEDNNINPQTGHGNRNFDAYASIDFYAQTTAPGAPTNLTISDASDRDNSKWRLTLAWDAASTGSTPDHYEVYRSTDNSSFVKIGEVNGTAYTDGGLTQSKTYYYKVYAVDNAGAKSLASNTVSKAPEGKYSTPPPAGGTPSASCGSTTCTISWTTTRNAYGTVEYGKTSSYGSSAAESTATKSHSIKISGLAPGTTYHYRVMALDDSQLVGYERSEAYSSDYTFTTLNTAAITGINVSDITLSSAIISWKTLSLSTSKVEYGETTNYGTTVEVSNIASESAHMVKLSNLKHSTTYHFRVRGTTIDGDDIFSEDNTFSTLVFPKISAVVFNTEQGEGGTSVVLAWATNVKTTAEVEYQGATIDKSQISNLKTQNLKTEDLQKLSPTELSQIPIIPKGKSQTVYNLKFDTKHLQRISGLDDGTIYVFTIRGRDEYGNQLVSDPIRYVTGSDTKPPAIYNQIIETPISGVGSEAKAQIIISWETDEPAVGQVIWGQGTGSEYPFTSEKEASFTTKHTIILRDLSPNGVYHLKILSQDKNKNKVETQDTVVVIPSAQQAAFDIILKNLEDIFGFLKL